MRTIALVVVAVTLSGCASTREESAIAFQQQSPQLVASCNMAFRDGSQFGRGIVVVREGVDACDRLAKEESLSLVDPVAVNTYQRYTFNRKRPVDMNSCRSGVTCSSTTGYSNQITSPQPTTMWTVQSPATAP